MKTKEKPKGPASTPPKVLFEGPVKLSSIRVVSNFRKDFDKKSLEELSANIKLVGVLQPVIVRKNGGAGYVLVAGERRYRGTTMAGLKEIPIRCLDLNAEQAEEIQAIENLHRKDLSIMEEAHAFKTLMDRRKYSAEQLAEKVDKSVNYVYRSVRLLELPVQVQAWIAEGILSPAHGHQLLRAPKDKWTELIGRLDVDEKSRGSLTAIEFRDTVDLYVSQRLSAAPFPKDVKYAGEIACSGCPYNSGNQGMLFNEAKGGSCLNGKCWNIKLEQCAKDKEVTAKQKAKKLGIQYLGRGGALGRDFAHRKDTFKGNVVVGSKEYSETAIAKAPDRFAIGVSAGKGSDKIRLVVVRIQPGEKKSRTASAAGRSKSESGEIRSSFVRAVVGAIRDQLVESYAAGKKRPAMATDLGKVLVALFEDSNDCDHIIKVLKTLAVPKAKGLALALFDSEFDKSWGESAFIKDIHLDFMSVNKKYQSHKLMSAAWKIHQPLVKVEYGRVQNDEKYFVPIAKQILAGKIEAPAAAAAPAAKKKGKKK